MKKATKKAKKPARSARYLLYADKKLQKLSLRKMSARLKKAKHARRSTRSKTAVRAPLSPMHFPWTMSPQAIVLAAICIVATAALITARQPSPRTDIALDAAPPAEAPAFVENAPMAERLETKKAVAVKTPATVAAPKPSIEPAAAVRVTEPPADMTASVTITGCLERSDETFWLTDTSGADVPKSRSWRSGFLTKRTPRIELVNAGQTLPLPNYVGQRVAATGTLMDREMQARSLRPVAAMCN
jgi:hypothetical protein